MARAIYLLGIFFFAGANLAEGSPLTKRSSSTESSLADFVEEPNDCPGVCVHELAIDWEIFICMEVLEEIACPSANLKCCLERNDSKVAGSVPQSTTLKPPTTTIAPISMTKPTASKENQTSSSKATNVRTTSQSPAQHDVSTQRPIPVQNQTSTTSQSQTQLTPRPCGGECVFGFEALFCDNVDSSAICEKDFLTCCMDAPSNNISRPISSSPCPTQHAVTTQSPIPIQNRTSTTIQPETKHDSEPCPGECVNHSDSAMCHGFHASKYCETGKTCCMDKVKSKPCTELHDGGQCVFGLFSLLCDDVDSTALCENDSFVCCIEQSSNVQPTSPRPTQHAVTTQKVIPVRNQTSTTPQPQTLPTSRLCGGECLFILFAPMMCDDVDSSAICDENTICCMKRYQPKPNKSVTTQRPITVQNQTATTAQPQTQFTSSFLHDILKLPNLTRPNTNASDRNHRSYYPTPLPSQEIPSSSPIPINSTVASVESNSTNKVINLEHRIVKLENTINGLENKIENLKGRIDYSINEINGKYNRTEKF